MNNLMRGRYKLFYSWATTRTALADVADHMRESCVISSENRGLARNLRQELMDHLRAGIADAAMRRAESGDVAEVRGRCRRPQHRENRRRQHEQQEP